MQRLKLLLPILFVLVLSFLFSTNCLAQDSSKRSFVKIIVKGVNNPKDAALVDKFIRSKRGILTSRMDYRTNIYFGIYDVNTQHSIESFNSWLKELGYEPLCYECGEHGKDPIPHMTTADCLDELRTEDISEINNAE